MRRRGFIAVGLAALAAAGTATASVVVHRIMLKPGACVTVTKTRVCAARAALTTVTESSTVTEPAVTLTNTVTNTVTVQTPAPAPSPSPPTPQPPPAPTPAPPITLDWSGNGDLTLPPFSLPVGETLTWTWVNGNGAYPTGLSIHDDAQLKFVVDADGNATSGSTYLPAGQHQLSTITVGTWTIHISG